MLFRSIAFTPDLDAGLKLISSRANSFDEFTAETVSSVEMLDPRPAAVVATPTLAQKPNAIQLATNSVTSQQKLTASSPRRASIAPVPQPAVILTQAATTNQATQSVSHESEKPKVAVTSPHPMLRLHGRNAGLETEVTGRTANEGNSTGTSYPKAVRKAAAFSTANCRDWLRCRCKVISGVLGFHINGTWSAGVARN